MAWFGIRGIGSIYYLVYAAGHGLAPETAQHFTSLVLGVVTISVIAHGVSATPLMEHYRKRA